MSKSQKHSANELFSAFFTCSPIGLYVVQNGKFKLVNPKFQRAIGYPQQELLEKESLSFVIPDHRERVRTSAIQMLKGESSVPYEFIVTTRDRKLRWIMESVTSIEFRGKLATLGNFMDITDRKLAEKALQERDELYRAVIEQAVETICLVDIKTKRIIESNPAFRRLLGYSVDELRSMKLYDYIADEPSNIDQHIEQIVRRGQHFLGERIWWRKDGSCVEMEVSANSISFAGTEACCVVARDISDRKKADKEYRFLSQRLMSVAEDERKKLARDLHDELGQMLTALRFVLDSLQISLPVNSEGMREKCCEALGLVEQIGSSIRNMLFELRPSMLDDLGFGPTVEWYLTRFRRQKPSVKVTFDALGVKGRLQPEQEIVLFRVLQECLNNISKHSGAENVEVSLTYSYPKIIFVVKDDGVGFDQTGERLVSDAETRGIGLLGMSERVASVDGTFDVISSRGKGTIVRVEMVDSRGATDEEDKNTDCG